MLRPGVPGEAPLSFKILEEAELATLCLLSRARATGVVGICVEKTAGEDDGIDTEGLPGPLRSAGLTEVNEWFGSSFLGGVETGMFTPSDPKRSKLS